MNGIINIYKEAGYTSFDVVARLRKILNMKKIGHTGTLDPDAVGVLPVCLGNATKVCDILTDSDKEYECELVLGLRTTTQDMSGDVVCESKKVVSREEFEKVSLSFVGEYHQTPPMYSALKVGGRKLVDLAREGIEVERKARRVEIIDLKVLDFDYPKARILVSCTKGTYIRTLVDDIGEKLGTYGTVSFLKRTKAHSFEIKDAIKLDDFKAHMEDGNYSDIIPVDRLFDYEKIDVSGTYEKLVMNGNVLPADVRKASNGEAFLVYDSLGIFRAIYEYHEDENIFVCRKMFL